MALAEILVGGVHQPPALAKVPRHAASVELPDRRAEAARARGVEQAFEAGMAVVAAHHAAHRRAEGLGDEARGEFGVHQVAGQQQHALPFRGGVPQVLQAFDVGEAGERRRRGEPRAQQFQQGDRQRALVLAQAPRARHCGLAGETQCEVHARDPPASAEQGTQQYAEPGAEDQRGALRETSQDAGGGTEGTPTGTARCAHAAAGSPGSRRISAPA